VVIDDELFRILIENLHDGVYYVDTRRVIKHWSAGAHRITGYTAEEVLGHSCADNILVHVDEAGCGMCRGNCPLSHSMKSGEANHSRAFLKHKEGHRVPVQVFVAPIKDAGGTVIGGLETFHDVSNPPYSIQEVHELKQTLYLCPLTGVPNRRYVEEVMPAKFDEFRKLGKPVAVMVLDVDHFKDFNDRYGHATGDLILKMVGRTLANAMRSYDLLARWGGEEFVAIMLMEKPLELERLAERLRALVQSSSRTVTRNKLAVTVSIGAFAADATADWDRAFRIADQRMYQSKRAGRNRVTID
jgi:diguanylate cyclase (GGDEF)-like protein/PAS domain S-box-containing protein